MVDEEAVSYVPVECKTVCWRIEGLSSLSPKSKDSKECIQYPNTIVLQQASRFSAAFGLGFSWRGEKEPSPLACVKRDGSASKLIWKAEAWIMNQCGGEDVTCPEVPMEPEIEDDSSRGFVIDVPNRGAAAEHVIDDSIIIKVRIKAWVPEVQSRISKAFASCPDATLALVTDMATLLANGEGSDVSLKAGMSESDGTEPQTFRAHRVMLAARSQVFQRMFFGAAPMAEAMPDAEVCLSDMEPQVAGYFLQFLYTGRLKDEVWKDDDAVCHLLSAGHKYEVSSLVASCVAHLISSFTEESVAERLMLADLLGINQIREAALEYMCASANRLSKIQSTEAFTRLGEKRPRLALEIMSKMVPPTSTRKRKAKPELPANLREKTVAQLKQLCNDRGIPTTGNKQALIERLENHASD